MYEEVRPILHAEDARIAIDDVVAIDRLTLRTRGDRVLLTGDCEPLLAALTAVPLRARLGASEDDGPPHEALVVAGTLLVSGGDVATRAHLATTGVAPLDPPLPKGMTAREYVAWSARLAGLSARSSRDLASSAIERVGLSSQERRPVESLDRAARRVLLLAHAIVTDPGVIVAEAPLLGLDGEAAVFVMNALSRATEGRGAIVSVGRLEPATAEGELSRGATDIHVFAGGDVVLSGSPEELFLGLRVYGVTIRKNAPEFRAELLARGISVKGGPLRMSVTLPSGASTKEILAAASKARAPIVELSPIVAPPASLAERNPEPLESPSA